MKNQSSHTISYWLVRFLLPSVCIVLAGSVMVGFIRAFIIFIPGIMGMAAGGTMGWFTGRIARRMPIATFAHSAGLTCGASLLYCISTLTLVSVLNTKNMGLPLDWLTEVLSGNAGEVFMGTSVNSLQSVEGLIKGGWWFTFTVLDLLLFAFLFMVSNSIGQTPDKTSERNSKEKKSRTTSFPKISSYSNRPLGKISFGIFFIVCFSIITLLTMWPVFGNSSHRITGSSMISELQGDWIFGKEAGFLGKTDRERTFTLSRGLGTELAGFSAVSAHFILSLQPRRNGTFEGRLMRRQVLDHLKIRMRPSDDLSELVFSMEIYTPMGWSEKTLTARRIKSVNRSN